MSVAQSCPWGSQSANKKKFEQTLYFVSMFLLPFSTSKQISAVVLALFQGQYPRTITMQLIRQLQWTDTKATSENLTIYFLENTKAQQRLTKKFILFSSTIFISQPAFTCSKLTTETLEQGVKYVQS